MYLVLLCRRFGLLFLLNILVSGLSIGYCQCSAIINTFPYRESFEAGTANWVSLGANNDWAWGTPTKPTINSAGAGTKCWIAGGLNTSFYNLGEKSWVQSPCFDLSTIDKPYISFLVFWDTEYSYDGGNIQYSLDGGTTWTTIGSSSEITNCGTSNWYNIAGVTNLSGLTNQTSGWAGTIQPSSGSCRGGHGIGSWVRATHCVAGAANKPQVIFRFTFGSGTTCNDYDGFAFDDFTIDQPPTQPYSITSSCTGNLEAQFTINNSNCFNNYLWDFGDSNSSSNSSSSPNSSHEFTTGGTYSVSLAAGGTCAKDTSISLSINIIGANISTTTVSCQGDSNGTAAVSLSGATATTAIQWNSDPLQNTSSINNLPIGNYSVLISDPNACGINLTAPIVEGPDSRPRLNIGNDTTICPGSYFIIKPPTFSQYLWQDGSSDSLFIIRNFGEFFLQATNNSGCIVSDSLKVKEDCLNDILFPSAFSPNEDGINELFYGVGTVPVSFLLNIYNRWGELIFESLDSSKGWDGNYKGHHCEDGIYIFRSEYSFDDVVVKQKAGRIFLIR